MQSTRARKSSSASVPAVASNATQTRPRRSTAAFRFHVVRPAAARRQGPVSGCPLVLSQRAQTAGSGAGRPFEPRAEDPPAGEPDDGIPAVVPGHRETVRPETGALRREQAQPGAEALGRRILLGTTPPRSGLPPLRYRARRRSRCHSSAGVPVQSPPRRRSAAGSRSPHARPLVSYQATPTLFPASARLAS